MFFHRSQDSCLVRCTPQESKLHWAGQYGRIWRWSRRLSFTFYLEKWYWDSYPFSRRVRHRHLFKHWIPCASRGVKVMWFPLCRWGGDLRLSLGSPQGIQTSLHLVSWNTNVNLSHCIEICLLLSQASRGTFHLWQKTQSPCHLPIAEGKLHLRCLWKIGSPLQSKRGNQLSSLDDMWCMELSSRCCAEMNIHIDFRWVSQRISLVSSRKSSHLYCILWNTG